MKQLDVILAALTKFGCPVTLPQLRGAVDMPPSSVKTALRTLVERNLIVVAGGGKKHTYAIPGARANAPKAQPNGNAARAATPDSNDGWSIGAEGDLVFETEVGDGLYVPRNRIAALAAFIEHARPLWERA